jgi:hypothetical protein
VWQTKSLGIRLADSKGVADANALEKVGELDDLPDVWQMKGLGEKP